MFYVPVSGGIKARGSGHPGRKGNVVSAKESSLVVPCSSQINVTQAQSHSKQRITQLDTRFKWAFLGVIDTLCSFPSPSFIKEDGKTNVVAVVM